MQRRIFSFLAATLVGNGLAAASLNASGQELRVLVLG